MKEEEGQKKREEGRMLSSGLRGNFGIIVRLWSMKDEIFC